jgi:dipeptidyl aminopeptidase/acylaminoacyl peptidase
VTPTVSPFGTWRSSVEAADLVEGALGLGYPVQAGTSVFWQEARPEEAGRVALVVRDGDGGGVVELLPTMMSSRSTVHEYGGRAWAVGDRGRKVITSNFEDQRLWDVSPGRPPRPLTPEPPEPRRDRFVCPAISGDANWAVVVRERHLASGVVNDLVAVSLVGDCAEPRVLAQGHDFYADPAFSADGRALAFVCWDHPDMPWDSTQLWRGHFSGGELGGLTAVAGQCGPESVLQPRWAPDGSIVYVSDRTGWWNLYRHDPTAGGSVNLAPMEAELAGPLWAMGGYDHTFTAAGDLVATWRSGGAGHLGIVGAGRAERAELSCTSPYTCFSHLAPGGSPGGAGVESRGRSVLVVAGGPARPPEIVRISLDGSLEVLRRSRPWAPAPEWISVAEPFSFPTGRGEQGRALYYPPRNPGFRPPPGEAPPLIVTSHGGPTGNASTALELRTQYWTTRGFAVVDVDYRGSTGYGRAYRQALEGQWGIADVEDCGAAALWLAGKGLADPRRIVVRGSSASGLTAMAALARHGIFAAGVVRYAVADLSSGAAGAHKFESRYIERLVPAGQAKARSPLAMAASVGASVLLLHGLDDKVVPPQQSRQMAAALRAAGTAGLLVQVEGEGHGFRKSSTVVRAQEAELAFYGSVLGFEPAGDLSRARADLAAAAGPDGAIWADAGVSGT